MITGIHEQAAANFQNENAEPISDRRLWSAVLLQALEDWGSSNMRLRAESEKFFFQGGDDFARVCRGAGMEPGCVLNKLQNMKRTPSQPAFRLPMVA